MSEIGAVRRLLALASTLLIGLGLAGAARATPLTVTANFNGVAPGLRIDFTLRDAPGMPVTLPKHSTTAGQFNWTTLSSNAGFAKQFTTFCIELNQFISKSASANPYTYDVVSIQEGSNPGMGTGGPGVSGPLGIIKADQIRQLWGMHHDEVADAISAAAFQIAIWEIIYGEHFTPFANTGGGSKLKNDGNAAIAKAAQWWQDVQVRDESLFETRLVAITNGGAQDEIALLAPTPGSLVLAGLGVVSLVGYARRRRLALA